MLDTVFPNENLGLLFLGPQRERTESQGPYERETARHTACAMRYINLHRWAPNLSLGDFTNRSFYLLASFPRLLSSTPAGGHKEGKRGKDVRMEESRKHGFGKWHALAL